MRIAIMQPYFLPYSGYFRLFEVVDRFVIYDCVQFPRRGWIHRNRLTNANGELSWLTLPIAKPPYHASINSLKFSEDSKDRLISQFTKFPALKQMDNAFLAHIVAADKIDPTTPVSKYLKISLNRICEILGLRESVITSSAFNLSPTLKGQDRILEICKQMKATEYVNSPGGKALYDRQKFDENGISLYFLKDYQGSPVSILEKFAKMSISSIADDIKSQSKIEMS